MASSEESGPATQEVAPLELADIPRLGLGGNPRIDESDVRAVLESAPGRSFWLPETGEFILVAPWRNRLELPSIHTLWSFSNDGPLIRAALQASMDAGAAALVMLETGERRSTSFYHRHGFTRIEIIRTYEHVEPKVLARQYDADVQQFTRVTARHTDLLTAVEVLDHAAFPWFWWNSTAEFRAYVNYPGVEVWAGIRDDQVISYFGFTSFHHWAHLDRIAVAPEWQGRGVGRSALGFAAQQMVRARASRIGLSTQSSNRVSRHLYESLGFRHTRQSDYDVYGIVIDGDRVFCAAGSASESHEG